MIKTKFFRFAEIVHLRLFGHSMSAEMRIFLGNLSWSFFGGVIAAGVMFIVNIIAGRWLGPEQYGGFQSLLSLASFFSALFLLGLHTSGIRYLADTSYSGVRREVFTSISVTVFLSALFFSGAVFFFSDFFSKILSIPKFFLFLSITLAFSMTMKELFNAFLRSFQKIKLQSFLRLFESFLVLGVFLLVFHFLFGQDHKTYFLAMLIGSTGFVVASLAFLKGIFSRVNFWLLGNIFRNYSFYVMLGSFVGSFIFIDRFLIGQFVGLYELGIYSAYYTSSHLVVAEIAAVFMNVFWPALIANSESKKLVLQKLFKIFVVSSPIWIGLVVASMSAFFVLFGKEYPWDILLIGLFSVNSFLGALFSLYLAFINIDQIKKGIALNVIFFLGAIGTLVIFRDIPVYIFGQIVMQIMLIYLIHKIIMKG